ncbi:MAG: succinate dehydrogenase, hydrophobic membrane anchor protein [Gammaproteobacteria bacterium]|nr:succinate dehydrogenase, hydrophobic membrane anchor protein [Gammaproteobacteria bacterium]MCY4218556.1 succinate dehydrogenase, hydrophobic membrane anchor protein [Gammaproteobacteria bacterium]MCY4275777.1 succinate dehydrogenase, hydrophobic membrane anchor protein [Gammaproteobacteria bacterium]
MKLELPLAKAKGLGTSGEGSHHWWRQRLSALALIPLTLWFLFSVVNQLGQEHFVVHEWIADPFTAVFLILYSIFMFYHAQLGLQVVIEDYVHNHGIKMAMLLFSNIVLLLFGILAVFSVLQIAL